MYHQLLDSLAMGIGYGLMFIGSLSAVLLVFTLAVNHCWRKMRDIYSFKDMFLAMRDYKHKKDSDDDR